jgi:uncharacterized protein
MTTERQRSEMAHYWWTKAEDSLASARREFEAGSLSFAMNRIYYSAFYGVCAVLMDHGLLFKKHSGVRSAFHHQFIKTGKLDPKWGKLYDQLFEDRQEGDYVVFVSFEHEYVESQLAECAQFLAELKHLLSPLPGKLGKVQI